MTVMDVSGMIEVLPDNMEIENRGRTYSPAAVENYIMEYMCSNLSAEEFAASKGISRSTFYWWLKVYVKDNGCRSYKEHEIPMQEALSEKIEERTTQRYKSGLKTTRTASEKEKLIKRYMDSGKSMSAFAEENNIPYGSLREWIHRYKKEGLEGLKSKKLRNAGAYEHNKEEISITEREMKDMIRKLRIQILELELRVIKLKEKINMNIESGWEQHERNTGL